MTNDITNTKFELLEKCPYCQGRDFVYLYSAPDRFSKNDEEFSLNRCSKCRLVFQNPRVKEKFIASYYTDELGYYSPSKEVAGLSSRLKTYLERHVLINHFNYINLGKKNIFLKTLLYPFKSKFDVKMVPVFVPNGKIFEFGCSHGANLKKMKDFGWEVVGTDMNSKSVNYAKSIGLDVTQSRVEDLDFPDQSFDAVCGGMVVEHVYNPFAVLENMTKFLKKNGQLIFSIPYFDGFEFRFFKEYSHSLHLPHHITFLNKEIIYDYLTRIGYGQIEFCFHCFDRDVVSSAGYKYEATGNYFYKLLGQNRIVRLMFVKPLVYVLSLFGKTSRVTVRAIKK